MYFILFMHLVKIVVMLMYARQCASNKKEVCIPVKCFNKLNKRKMRDATVFGENVLIAFRAYYSPLGTTMPRKIFTIRWSKLVGYLNKCVEQYLRMDRRFTVI